MEVVSSRELSCCKLQDPFVDFDGSDVQARYMLLRARLQLAYTLEERGLPVSEALASVAQGLACTAQNLSQAKQVLDNLRKVSKAGMLDLSLHEDCRTAQYVTTQAGCVLMCSEGGLGLVACVLTSASPVSAALVDPDSPCTLPLTLPQQPLWCCAAGASQ